MRNFAETHHGDAKGDIATVFASRIFRWLGDHGTQALVTPQNWLFLTTLPEAARAAAEEPDVECGGAVGIGSVRDDKR